MYLVNFLTSFNGGALWLIFMAFARFLGAMSISPLFSSSFLSLLLRASLSLMLACLVYPSSQSLLLGDNYLGNVLLVASNYVYGCMLGYFISFPIWLIESSVNLIDMQRGEQIGAIVNQLTNNPASSIAKMLTKGFITYLVINGGLLFFLDIIFKSFSVIPLNNLIPLLDANHIQQYIKFIVDYFYWVVVLALPMIVAMFLIDIVLGLISSFIPQMNVTVISMPIKSSGALILLSIYIGSFFHNVFIKFIPNFKALLL